MSPINKPALTSPPDLGAQATKDITGALNALLTDIFALYPQDQEFSLAHEWTVFLRLPSFVR
jgi:hypothetical protein